MGTWRHSQIVAPKTATPAENHTSMLKLSDTNYFCKACNLVENCGS